MKRRSFTWLPGRFALWRMRKKKNLKVGKILKVDEGVQRPKANGGVQMFDENFRFRRSRSLRYRKKPWLKVPLVGPSGPGPHGRRVTHLRPLFFRRVVLHAIDSQYTIHNTHNFGHKKFQQISLQPSPFLSSVLQQITRPDAPLLAINTLL
jgi:hypothetical protein